MQDASWVVQDLHQKGQEARDGSMIKLHPHTPIHGIYDLPGFMAVIDWVVQIS